MKRLVVLLGIVVCLALAGCGGGDDDSTADVGAKLDDACTELSSILVSLPQKQNDEDLSTEQLQALADDAGEKLKATIDSLDVPTDLEDTKQELLDTFDAPDPADVNEYKVRLANTGKLYTELGADRCNQYGEASIKVLDGASVADAYKGLPLPGVGGLDSSN